MLEKMPMGVFAFIFLILFFLLYFVLYVYIYLNLKKICGIVFDDEYRYKAPLEPFDFLFLSLIPATFWRELLNLKKNIKFKKLYEKDFYLKMSEEQLISLLRNFPYFLYCNIRLYFQDFYLCCSW